METPRTAHSPDRRRARPAAMLALAVLCLAGCGQSGPLYLPDEDARTVPAVQEAAGDEEDEDGDGAGR